MEEERKEGEGETIRWRSKRKKEKKKKLAPFGFLRSREKERKNARSFSGDYIEDRAQHPSHFGVSVVERTRLRVSVSGTRAKRRKLGRMDWINGRRKKKRDTRRRRQEEEEKIVVVGVDQEVSSKKKKKTAKLASPKSQRTSANAGWAATSAGRAAAEAISLATGLTCLGTSEWKVGARGGGGKEEGSREVSQFFSSFDHCLFFSLLLLCLTLLVSLCFLSLEVLELFFFFFNSASPRVRFPSARSATSPHLDGLGDGLRGLGGGGGRGERGAGGGTDGKGHCCCF